jgi:hypothetical protein
MTVTVTTAKESFKYISYIYNVVFFMKNKLYQIFFLPVLIGLFDCFLLSVDDFINETSLTSIVSTAPFVPDIFKLNLNQIYNNDFVLKITNIRLRSEFIWEDFSCRSIFIITHIFNNRWSNICKTLN